MEKKLKVRIESVHSGKVQEFETKSLIMSSRQGESLDEEFVRCYMMGHMSEKDMVVLLAGVVNTIENQIGIEFLDVIAKALTLASTRVLSSEMEDLLNGKNNSHYN